MVARTASKTTVFDTKVLLRRWTEATRDGCLQTGFHFSAVPAIRGELVSSRYRSRSEYSLGQGQLNADERCSRATDISRRQHSATKSRVRQFGSASAICRRGTRSNLLVKA